MNWTAKSAMVLAVLLSIANGAELKPETIHEWEDYLARADAHMMERMQRNFLRVDESEQRLQRVRSGGIVVAPIQPKMPIAVPHGLVHHWVGAAFIPGVHIESTHLRIGAIFVLTYHCQLKNFNEVSRQLRQVEAPRKLQTPKRTG
jgi:hypothetical protein